MLSQIKEPELFRRDLMKPDVRVALARHRDLLIQLFQFYCSLPDPEAGIPTSNDAEEHGMSVGQFKLFCEHSKICQNGGFDVTQVEQLFCDIQAEEPMDGDEELDEEHNPNELNFSEFLEAIGALILFKDPNPYVPFIKKIDNFMQRHVALTVRRLPSKDGRKPDLGTGVIESGRRASATRRPTMVDRT